MVEVTVEDTLVGETCFVMVVDALVMALEAFLVTGTTLVLDCNRYRITHTSTRYHLVAGWNKRGCWW